MCTGPIQVQQELGLRDDQWGTFVGNRVRKILEVSGAEDWNCIPGELNPADLPSRGCDVKHLLESS